MPAYGYDEDDDYGQTDNGPKALRDALKKAQDDLKARDAEIATLKEQAATLSKQVKSSTLRDALSDAGLDPKYARFAERDEVEPNVESVKKWADENKDVYAFLNKPAAEAPPGDDDGDAGDAGPEDQIDPALAAQILAAQQLSSDGRPSGSTTIQDTLAAINLDQFKDGSEIDALIRSMGAPTPGD